MVLYKKEYDLWRATDPTQRGKLLQRYADLSWLTIDMQRDRISDWTRPESGEDVALSATKLRLDLEFFFIGLNRLIQVANVVRETADPRSVMPAAKAKFDQDTEGLGLDPDALKPMTVTDVRNSMEHFLNLKITGGFGIQQGDYGEWFVLYRNRMFDTRELHDAAYDLWLAIRSAVDIEAFADFRPEPPLFELRSPDQIPAPDRRLEFLNYRGHGSSEHPWG